MKYVREFCFHVFIVAWAYVACDTLVQETKLDKN